MRAASRNLDAMSAKFFLCSALCSCAYVLYASRPTQHGPNSLSRYLTAAGEGIRSCGSCVPRAATMRCFHEHVEMRVSNRMSQFGGVFLVADFVLQKSFASEGRKMDSTSWAQPGLVDPYRLTHIAGPNFSRPKTNQKQEHAQRKALCLDIWLCRFLG